jgi:hypothetical protein
MMMGTRLGRDEAGEDSHDEKGTERRGESSRRHCASGALNLIKKRMMHERSFVGQRRLTKKGALERGSLDRSENLAKLTSWKIDVTFFVDRLDRTYSNVSKLPSI